MIYDFYAVHIVTCLFLILVVLLQQGKGADLSVFGGGATQTAFGARSAATLLHKLTVGFFVMFIVTTLSIGIVQRQSGGSSIMLDVESAPPDTAANEEATAVESTPIEAPTADVESADEAAAVESTGEATTASEDAGDPEN